MLSIALWMIGGAFVLALAAIIVGAVVLDFRERWLRIQRRYTSST